MSRFSNLAIAGWFVFLTLTTGLNAQEPAPVRFMFYNVENFFDTDDDSLTADNDFLPSGVMRWTNGRYLAKRNALYKTIVAAGTDKPPSIIAFCEVENRQVISDLVYGTWLSKFSYRIVHEESPDPRGIDVCLIYRCDSLSLLRYAYWVPAQVQGVEFSTRSVLYACFLVKGDTVHLVVNHWPSRRGGVLAAEDTRTKIAEMVRKRADSLCAATSGKFRLIITGDFNCTPADPVIKLLTERGSQLPCLENLSAPEAERGKGTYRYRGTWELIDQVLISCDLKDTESGLFTSAEKMRIFDQPFLLRDDPAYPGKSPASTYRGYKYQGGFSDHLPVLLDLVSR